MIPEWKCGDEPAIVYCLLPEMTKPPLELLYERNISGANATDHA